MGRGPGTKPSSPLALRLHELALLSATLMRRSLRSLTAPMVLSCWPPAMPRKSRTLAFALAAILVLGVLALTLGRTPPRPPLPNPNGYDDFVKAGAAVPRSVFVDLQTLDRAGLRDLVSTNAESLRLLRLGLTRQCVMPMNPALTNFAGWMTQQSGLKRLFQLLAAEGRLRESDNRAVDAARSYTDAIRFGNEMSRGGLLTTRLVGITIEAMGCGHLVDVMPRLGREDARIVLAGLERLEAGRVTWAEVRQNERYFCSHGNGGHFNPLMGAIAWWQTRQTMEEVEAKHKAAIAHERLLAAELALRCYQSDKGHPPARLDDLVTNYLSRAPQDPFSGKQMSYRPQGTNWLLYSVGPDGVDDGGRPAGWGSQAKGDILFDSSW